MAKLVKEVLYCNVRYICCADTKMQFNFSWTFSPDSLGIKGTNQEPQHGTGQGALCCPIKGKSQQNWAKITYDQNLDNDGGARLERMIIGKGSKCSQTIPKDIIEQFTTKHYSYLTRAKVTDFSCLPQSCLSFKNVQRRSTQKHTNPTPCCLTLPTTLIEKLQSLENIVTGISPPALQQS